MLPGNEIRIEHRLAPEFDALARQMLERLDRISDRQLEISADAEPDWFAGDPVAARLRRDLSRQGFLSTLEAFAARELPESLPTANEAATKALVHMSLDLDLMLGAYRSGHRALWEEWFALVNERAGDGEDRDRLVVWGSQFFFSYTERISRLATEVYRKEQNRATQNSGHRRMQLVREFLDGAEIESAAIEWPLEHHHLAIVAQGEGGDMGAGELSRLLERPLLLLEAVEGWWGWLSSAVPLSAGEERRLAAWSPSRGQLYCGLESAGRDGFRRSHFQAARVQWAADGGVSGMHTFDQLVLEVLAGERSADARAFVDRELRGLAGEEPRAITRRETLSAYFGADGNAAAAAAALGVHEQTVANRLRTIEELIGRPVSTRRAELETALRLRKVFERGESDPRVTAARS